MFSQLSVVQQLQDRCTRLEACSNQSETCTHGTIKPSGEQNLSPDCLIYLLGGYDGTSWLGSLDSYYSSKDEIKSQSIMSSMRSYTAVATLNGDLYVIGGGHMGLWYDTGMKVLHVLFALHFPCNTVKKFSLLGSS